MPLKKNLPTVRQMSLAHEKVFQQFCYPGRTFRETFGKNLTAYQRNIMQAILVSAGETLQERKANAAKRLGITIQRLNGHVSLIESKGWTI